MVKVNMHEAKSQLSRLAGLAREGEEVVICRAGRPWVRLIPHEGSAGSRKPGGFEGKIRMPPDFDREDEQIIAAFENPEVLPGGE